MTQPIAGELRKILCLRLRSMGDAVLMTPALRALRSGLPEAEVDVVLESELAPLLDGHPHLDRVLPLRRGVVGKISLAAALRTRGYDAVLNFHGGPTSAWLTGACAAPLRVGRASYRFAFFYNVRAARPEVIFSNPAAIHTVHHQASLVSALGLPVGDLSLHLKVSPAGRSRIEERLGALGLAASGYVLLQPTASFRSKRWPAERFLALGRELQRRTGRDIVVTLPPSAGPGGLFAPDFAVLYHLPIDELVALVEGASIYLGNDSGPMHVAAALRVPVVGIFGSSDPRRWHPWGVAHRSLWAGLPCSPCHGKWCANPDQFACLDNVRVEAVIEAALDLLSKSASLAQAGGPEPSRASL